MAGVTLSSTCFAHNFRMNTAASVAIDSQIRKAIEAFVLDSSVYEFDLASLELKIRLSGPKWAGIVDKPIAKFLIDLDDMLNRELKKFGVELPESKHGLVALKIEDGSLEAFLQYSKGIFQELRKMKPWQQILLATTILGALGINASSSIIEALNQAKIEEIRASERVSLVEAVTAIEANSREVQAPVRKLVANMGDEDTVLLPVSETPLKKAQANEALVKSTRSKPKTYFVDHRYIVQELLTKDPENWEIGLRFGDVSFRAKILLTHDQVSSLMADFQAAHQKGSEIAPDLQVTATINERGIQNASLVGIGEPRADSLRLSEALAKGKQTSP